MENKKFKLFALYLLNAVGTFIYLFTLVVSFQFTYSTLLSGICWFILLLIPAIITILFNNKIWNYVAFIMGILTTFVNLFICVVFLINSPLMINLILLFYWGIIGISTLIFSFKWMIRKSTLPPT
jgi:hypothetical protein